MHTDLGHFCVDSGTGLIRAEASLQSVVTRTCSSSPERSVEIRILLLKSENDFSKLYLTCNSVLFQVTVLTTTNEHVPWVTSVLKTSSYVDGDVWLRRLPLGKLMTVDEPEGVACS